MNLSVHLKQGLVFLFISLGWQTLSVEAKQLESQYFDVKLHDGAEVFELYSIILRDHLVLTEIVPLKKEEDLDNLLMTALDGLFEEVADILDIHLQDFKISLEVFPDKAQLKERSKQSDPGRAGVEAFYLFINNTIYVSLEDLSVNVFAHEIAHAIISYYFVIPPPEKIQEILSGYVDFKIRKSILKSGVRP